MLSRLLLLAAISWIAAAPAQAQMLFKCRDAAGRISYSDKSCDAPAPAAASRPPVRAAEGTTPPMPAITGPLDAAGVEAVLRKALQLVDAGDAEGPCALAAPALRFSVVHRGTGPVWRRSGGRAELCAAHREDAGTRAVGKIQLRTVIASKLDVRVNPDGRGASASYLTESRISQQGTLQLTLRCKREEVLGLHGDRLLFESANATCDAV